MTTPDYRRSWIEGNLTNHVIRPLLCARFGVDVPQPIAGEVAVTGAVAAQALRRYQAAPPAIRNCIESYGIDALLACIACQTGRIGVVRTSAMKCHAPSFPHLEEIYWGELPIVLSFFSEADAPSIPVGHYKLEWADTTPDERTECEARLIALGASYGQMHWPESLARAAMRATQEGCDVLGECRMLWKRYISRVLSFLANHWDDGAIGGANADLNDAGVAMIGLYRTLRQM